MSVCMQTVCCTSVTVYTYCSVDIFVLKNITYLCVVCALLKELLSKKKQYCVMTRQNNIQ